MQAVRIIRMARFLVGRPLLIDVAIIAELFEVSTRQVHRDLRLLESAGFAVVRESNLQGDIFVRAIDLKGVF